MLKQVPPPKSHPNKTDAMQVEVMSGYGAPPAHIASHLRLTLEELKLHYHTQLERGPDEANLKVAATFFDMATSGEHPQVTVAWMKMRAGWMDTPPTQQEEDTSTPELAREKLKKLLNRGK